MANQTPFTSVRDQIATELDGDMKAIGEALRSEMLMGMTKKSEPEFLDLVRRHWHDPAFRQGLQKQFGDATLKEIAMKAGVLQPAPQPPPTPMGMPPMGAQPPGVTPPMPMPIQGPQGTPMPPESPEIAPGGPMTMGQPGLPTGALLPMGRGVE